MTSTTPSMPGTAIAWSAIEPSQGQFDWTTLDPWLQQSVALHKNIDLIVTAGSDDPHGSSRRPSRWRELADLPVGACYWAMKGRIEDGESTSYCRGSAVRPQPLTVARFASLSSASWQFLSPLVRGRGSGRELAAFCHSCTEAMMDITYTREPVVGEQFEFDVVEFVGRAYVEVSVRGKVVRKKECPDPPCHQVFGITRDLRGQTLTITAYDTSGDQQTLELSVVDYDDETMTAGA